MLCKICNKNPATIHIQEIINGEKKSLHICAECAAKKSQNDPVLQGFNLAEMLYNLSGQIDMAQDEEHKDEALSPDAQNLLVCEDCGWDTAKFRKTGRLGCAKCYLVFRDILASALKNMHRGAMHVGKRPGGENNREAGKLMLEIMNLQKELDELVQREEYEKAAVVRDKINALKNNA